MTSGPTIASERLKDVVQAHGGDPTNAISLEFHTAAALPYASLDASRAPQPDILGPVLGVYEWQGSPLLVIIDGDELGDSQHLSLLRRLAALRGDIPYLGVTAGGRLDIYTVGLDSRPARRVETDTLPAERAMLLPYVASLRPDLPAQQSTVSNVVLKLLDGALTTLIRTGLSEANAISLAGRALFARFLADRDLPLGPHMSGRPSETAFANAEMAALTCEWLDRTFNGNLLPLTGDVFAQLSPDGFGVLIDIMRRAPDRQMSLGWAERWDNLHFAHIPVGILSQVYERYLKTHELERQKKEGSYYTPIFIADLMVRATLAGLEPKERHKARFLDPAAGAGVFLITAFRHLVAERWAHDGVRPDTQVLRSILYDQIAGFDVNEAALRFTALGLYLISIELDPEPEPVSKLKFEDLRGKVLSRPMATGTIRVRKEDVPLSRLGSLGPGVSDEHQGRYDIVIGNPPWKSATKVPAWRWVENNTDRIATLRLGAKTRDLLPNEALDLPFVWRATEWARPGGQIAFALHGRLLFEQGHGMPTARSALMRALDLTSLVNGAALRQTRVWPEVSAPFLLMFARNRTPQHGASVRFVSPHLDPPLNKAGIMRLDTSNAPIVRIDDVLRQPEKLKILFRGSELDLQLQDRILAAGDPPLASLAAASGTGLQTLKASSRRRKDEELPGADATYLEGLPYLAGGRRGSEVTRTALFDAQVLPKFADKRIHDPRDKKIFRGPLLIVAETMRAECVGMLSGYSRGDLAYGESFYGYSFADLPHGETQAIQGLLILRSRLARWWALMRSGKYGFERDGVEKTVIDRLPVPAMDGLSPEQVQAFHALRSQVLSTGQLSQDHVEEWVASIYGLTAEDRRIISDTLDHAGAGGAAVCSSVDVSSFLDGLLSELKPWSERFGNPLANIDLDPSLTPGWRFVGLKRRGATSDSYPDPQILAGFISAADATGSTEIFHDDGAGRLWIGMLTLTRYWSFSQGLRAARHLVWRHIKFIAGDRASKELHV